MFVFWHLQLVFWPTKVLWKTKLMLIFKNFIVTFDVRLALVCSIIFAVFVRLPLGISWPLIFHYSWTFHYGFRKILSLFTKIIENNWKKIEQKKIIHKGKKSPASLSGWFVLEATIPSCWAVLEKLTKLFFSKKQCFSSINCKCCIY